MKILYHHRIRSKDGQYLHMQELIVALRNLGHEVILVGPRAVEKEKFGADAGVVDILKKAMPSAAYEMLEFAYAVLDYLRVRKVVRRDRPDCIYERYNLFLPSGVWIKRRYHLPLLLEVNAPVADERSRYNGLSLRRLAHRIERLTWKGADFVLPVTQVLAERVKSEGVPESQIAVIPNGVRLDQFEGLPAREEAKRRLGLAGRLVLGFTGFVRDWHGLDHVIDLIAAHRPNRRDWHLLVVGDGPARRWLEKRARDRGVESSVTFAGVVGRDRLPDHLAAFDVALQPAVVDYASPLKVFEYMAAGCAIVAPATANVLEVLTHGEDSFLFAPETPESFAQAIETVCNDEELRHRLGKHARQTLIARGFLWENNAKRVVQLFDRLLQRETAGLPPQVVEPHVLQKETSEG
jgi:glycosyltransferase involved in cell wall biosynthesis